MITAAQLKAVMPNCQNPEGWEAPLNCALGRISSDLDSVAAFLAQIAVESAELTRLTENLNYKPDRLVAVWPSRFPTVAAATPYAGNPHALANHVYANRLGNGDEASGDGWEFRGRGLIMVTFRGNYEKLQKELGFPLVSCPDILCTKGPAALAAAQFWNDNKLNFLGDTGTEPDFVTMTRRINGGTTGLALREKYWTAFRQVLGETK